MKGLSSLERIVLDCLGKEGMSYNEVQHQTGLHENVCFNILQALIIRGILTTDGVTYKVGNKMSPMMLEEINGTEAKLAESLEMIEAVLDQKTGRHFRYQKIAMDERDEKIFLAMLSNMESFLVDAHKKAQSSVPLKKRKVVFWGVGEVQNLMTQIVRGH
jgi:predicted DNA-binding transcriptional regulator